MFFKNVLRRLTSFLLAHAPFAIFILVALPPLSNIVPPVLAVPAVTKSTTPHIPVDDFEEDEGFVVINLAPSKHCLSPSSRHINVRHTHTTQPTQPAVAAGDTATIANESSLSPVADDVPEPINSFLSISYSCTDLSQFLIEDRETSPAYCGISLSEDKDIDDDFSIDESTAASDQEDDGFWELSSSEDTDSISIHSTTSDDMAEEPKDISINTDSDADNAGDSHDGACGWDECDSELPYIVKPSLTTPVASAVPLRVRRELRDENSVKCTPAPPQVAPRSVDDLDIFDNYNVSWLTPRAVLEAERRSRKVERVARMRARTLSKIPPLKPHQYAAPKGRRTPAVLKDLGRSSNLRQSYNMYDLEEEVAQEEAQLQGFWDDEVF